jgi:hypothetical protein
MWQMPTTWMAPNNDGHLELVVAPPADYLLSPQGLARQSQTGPKLGWSGWTQLALPYLGFTAYVQPRLAMESDGRLAVFVTDGKQFWEQYQTSAGDDGSWTTSWQSLGSPGANLTVGQAVLGMNQNGTMELFTVASDGQVHHVWQQSTGGDTNWSGWNFFTSPPNMHSVGTPATASYPYGAQIFSS